MTVLFFCKCSGEALTEFLKVLNDSSGHITDWNDHFVSPCFSWSHVTCRNGNVISLNPASNEFSGTFSPSITELKFLVNLDLQNNDLPAEFAYWFFCFLWLILNVKFLMGPYCQQKVQMNSSHLFEGYLSLSFGTPRQRLSA